MTDYVPERAAVETPTQVQHPWRATLRTVLANILGVILVGAPALAVAWGIIVDEASKAGVQLPGEVVLIASGILTGIAIVTGAVTRIMAIPAVSEWLTRIGLGPAPKTETPTNPEES